VAPPDRSERPASDLGEDQDLALRRLVLRFVLGFGCLFAAVWVLAYFFRVEVEMASHWFVDRFGGPGVAVGFFIPDAFTLPLPNDAFTMFGRLGGMPYWSVVFWGSLGSIAGGSTGWAIGYWGLSHLPTLRAWFERKGATILARVHRRGTIALAAAALTPIPYSVTCWAAGAVKMPFWRFFAVSTLRIVRVAFYLWLIEAGVTAAMATPVQ